MGVAADNYSAELSLFSQGGADDLYDQLVKKPSSDAAAKIARKALEAAPEPTPAPPSPDAAAPLMSKAVKAVQAAPQPPPEVAAPVARKAVQAVQAAPPPVSEASPPTESGGSLFNGLFSRTAPRAAEVAPPAAASPPPAAEPEGSFLDAFFTRTTPRVPEAVATKVEAAGTALSKAATPEVMAKKAAAVDVIQKAAATAKPAVEAAAPAVVPTPLPTLPAAGPSETEQGFRALLESTRRVVDDIVAVPTAIANFPGKVVGDAVAAVQAFQAEVVAFRASLPGVLQPLAPEDPNALIATGLALGLILFVGVPALTLYNVRYGGYSGDRAPAEVLQMLRESNTLLVDIRSPAEVVLGVPDLRRSARGKAIRVAPVTLPASVRRRSRDAAQVERTLQALTVASLRRARDAEAVVVMDQTGKLGREFARILKSKGINNAFVMVGGYEQWTQDRLGIRARYETDVTETLRQDVAAMTEEEDNPIGQAVAFVRSGEGKLKIGLGLGAGAVVAAYPQQAALLGALALSAKLVVDGVTDGSYNRPRVGPDGEEPPPKEGIEKLQEDFQEALDRAQDLQQQLGGGLERLQFMLMKDLWGVPAGDTLKLLEDRSAGARKPVVLPPAPPPPTEGDP